MDKDFLKELFAELEKDNASNVVPLHESPDPRVSAAKVLLSALETVLESVLVLGYGDDGNHMQSGPPCQTKTSSGCLRHSSTGF